MIRRLLGASWNVDQWYFTVTHSDPWEENGDEIWIELQYFSFSKMNVKKPFEQCFWIYWVNLLLFMSHRLSTPKIFQSFSVLVLGAWIYIHSSIPCYNND